MSSKANSGRRLAGLALLAAVSFVATVTLLHRGLPPPRPPGLMKIKLAHYLDRAGEIDVLFFGSSRVYHSVSPRAFDRAAASAGLPVRSFNLALPGMLVAEVSHLLRQLARDPTARPRWVLLEFQTEANFGMANRLSDRAIYSHDPAATWLALRAVGADAGRAGAESWRHAYNHIVALLYRQLNVSRLQMILQKGRLPQATARQAYALEMGPDGDGYLPIEIEVRRNEFVRARRAEFLVSQDGFRSRIESWGRDGVADPNAFAPSLVHLLTEQVEALGAQPVFVVPPGRRPQPWPGEALGAGAPPHLDFNDPGRYPQFFRPESRFDGIHLTDEAARELSRLLAERFVALARPQATAP